MKKYFILCLFLINYSLFFAQQITYRETILAPPDIMDCASPRPIQNQIIYGANINSQKPVLVFVHGFFDTGYGWFALSNKMYKNAFDNGYRTAFLMQPQNNPVDKTGEILAKMIAQVKSHYGVNQVIAIVHSKGALDIEAAMYMHNMESSIQNVIAVSGSFHGAVIADIFNNPLLRILSQNLPLVGPVMRQGGAADLQTAYVNQILRPLFDNSPLNHPEKFICLGGTGFTRTSVNIPFKVANDLISLGFYRIPLCEPANVGPFYRALIKGFFSLTGTITRFIKPQGSPLDSFNDGLVGFNSAMRSGCHQYWGELDSRNFLNHFDFLYSNPTWTYIQDILINIENGTLENFPIYASKINENELGVVRGGISFVSNNYPNLSINKEQIDNIYLVENNEETIDELESIKNLNSQDFNYNYTSKNKNSFFGVFENKPIHSFEIILPYTKEQNFINPQISNSIAINVFDNNDISVNAIKEIFLVKNMNLDGTTVNEDFFNFKTSLDHIELPKDLSDGIYNLTVVSKIGGENIMLSTSIVINNEKEITKKIFDSKINIFPNPAKSFCTIESSNNTSNNTLKVFDINGKLILEDKNISIPYFLDLNQLKLTNGQYIINLNGSTSKLIIQN